MNIFIDKGSKIKIKNINFTGNKALSESKLRAAMLIPKENLLVDFGRDLNTLMKNLKKILLVF